MALIPCMNRFYVLVVSVTSFFHTLLVNLDIILPPRPFTSIFAFSLLKSTVKCVMLILCAASSRRILGCGC